MKTKLAFLLLLALVPLGRAQVQPLPPDFVLFGKTSGDYLAEFHQYTDPLSTNGDYLLPKAVRSATDPVYFLQRPYIGVADPNSLQTYFVPDDAYVYFPIASYAFDNIGNSEPWTVAQLWDALNSVVDAITNVHATIDGVVLTNLAAYRINSPVFSVFYPTNDNIISEVLGDPYEGLDDPVVAGGYLLMLRPLTAGLHDFRTGDVFQGVISITFERHFQINVFHTNHPPVADASATPLRVISPGNRDARVVLDGSQSSDPDNDPLTFSWIERDSLIGTGILSTNAFSVGLHEVLLVVDDGTLSATNPIVLYVTTSCQAIGDLASQLEAAQLARKKLKRLSEDLRKACDAFEHAFKAVKHERPQHLEHAVKELLEFEHDLKEELHRSDPTLADNLIAGAQQIIEAVGLPRHYEHGEQDDDDEDTDGRKTK